MYFIPSPREKLKISSGITTAPLDKRNREVCFFTSFSWYFFPGRVVWNYECHWNREIKRKWKAKAAVDSSNKRGAAILIMAAVGGQGTCCIGWEPKYDALGRLSPMRSFFFAVRSLKGKKCFSSRCSLASSVGGQPRQLTVVFSAVSHTVGYVDSAKNCVPTWLFFCGTFVQWTLERISISNEQVGSWWRLIRWCQLRFNTLNNRSINRLKHVFFANT